MHNKKSDLQLQAASKLDNIDCLTVNDEGKISCESDRSISNSKMESAHGEGEIEMCLEEIEKNLVKLR